MHTFCKDIIFNEIRNTNVALTFHFIRSAIVLYNTDNEPEKAVANYFQCTINFVMSIQYYLFHRE